MSGIKEENSVLKNIKSFLDENMQSMDNCYNAIRGNNGERLLRNELDEISNEDFDSEFPLVSAVILTANKFECDALNYLMNNYEEHNVKKRRDKIHIFKKIDINSSEAYLFKISSCNILHLLASETGSNTPGGSTDLVRFVSNHPQLFPTCIISFGICYGRDSEKQKIGDVIIPIKLYPWSIGQKIVDKNFKIKHDNFNLFLSDKFSESGLYSAIESYCNGFDGTIIQKTVSIPMETNFNINVKCGNMSTGEAVVSSKKIRDYLHRATGIDNELGGEMEGYGLAKECIYYANIPCIIVKGICDWGEMKDIERALAGSDFPLPPHLKDSLQAYAAFCSGIILLDLLSVEKEKFLLLKLIKFLNEKKVCSSIHYNGKSNIIQSIQEYFCDECDAEKIFDDLVKFQKLIKVDVACLDKTVYRSNGGNYA